MDGVTDDDVDVMARTIYGEARGESLDGKIAVAQVILNRARAARDFRARRGRDHPLFGDGSPASACKMPWQFSCWNETDPNRSVITRVDLGDRAFRDCFYAALAAVQGHEADVTAGATHYHADHLSPGWAEGHEYRRIGRHRFYTEVA